MNAINHLNQFSTHFSSTTKMPVLFVGHGNPMNALIENQFTNGFKQIAKQLPKPNAILVISAHWFTNGIKVTAMNRPRTIHDFLGFPKELFEVQYPAIGSPVLALETQNLLKPFDVELDNDWGLDHGSWSVLKYLYPNVNIPIIQLSIDFTKEPVFHFELAKYLRSLRYKGILIIGSGNIIHNLSLIDWKNFETDNYGYNWAKEVQMSINNLILDGNFQSLIDYKKRGKAFQLAIPTPEHFLPLIYTLGLHEKGDTIQLFNNKLMGGSLSMTSLKIS